MNIPIGWIIAMACALGGYALHGGNIMVLWQPTEVLTIVGAAVGTMIAANTPTNLKKMFAGLGGAFKGAGNVKQKSLDLLCLMFEILQKIKRDGLMSLEGDIEEPESSPLFEKYPEILKDHHLVDFITDYLRMMLGGSLDVIQIESLMEQELDVHHTEAHIPVNAVTNVGDGLPAFGIVAAVMGVVHTMGSIGLPPAELGKLIGAALVGTFLGILLAYAFVSPVAKVLEQKADAEGRFYMAIKAILIASLNNFPPAAAVEFGRKVLFSYQRPSFAELDEGTKAVKGK
jgi:chemotaxis protein MotA